MPAVLHPLMRAAMRTLACLLMLFLLRVPIAQAAFTDLVSLGSGSYTIVPNASIGTYTQDATGTTFSPSVALGDMVGGAFSPLDWSSYTDLTNAIYLKISFAGTNPLLPMTLEIFNADFSQSMSYQGTTAPIDESPDYFRFNLVSPFTSAVLANVGGAQITWDGGANVNATMQSIATEASSPPTSEDGSFTARAPGGVRFLTSTNETAGMELAPEGSSWQILSDSNAKTDITAVDHRGTLQKLAALPVTGWCYKHDTSREYIGPMAQDFHAAFGLGLDDKHITTLDLDGVALSSLKGLIEELQERKERSAAQAKRLNELEVELDALRKAVLGSLPPVE